MSLQNIIKFDNPKDAPIVILDSGIGGLVALKKLREEFPVENFLYFCDNQMLPVGNKNEVVLNRRVAKICKLIKPIKPKAIVIACNTFDAISKDTILSIFPNVPVFSIIEPTIKKALKTTRNKKIAILATKNTTNSQAYMQYAISKQNLQVYGVECIDLANSIENNDNVKQVMLKETSTLKEVEYDTLVLGCTHYSFIKKQFEKEFKDKNIVDCTDELIENIKNNFDEHIKNKANKQKTNIIITQDNQVIESNIKKIIKDEYQIDAIKI